MSKLFEQAKDMLFEQVKDIVREHDSTLAPALAPGQVWKENDPRNERYVLVLPDQVTNVDMVKIVRCSPQGVPFNHSWRAAQKSRFNGKRSGYSFTGKTVCV